MDFDDFWCKMKLKFHSLAFCCFQEVSESGVRQTKLFLEKLWLKTEKFLRLKLWTVRKFTPKIENLLSDISPTYKFH